MIDQSEIVSLEKQWFTFLIKKPLITDKAAIMLARKCNVTQYLNDLSDFSPHLELQNMH